MKTNRICMNRPTPNNVKNINTKKNIGSLKNKSWMFCRPCRPSEDWNSKRCCILSDCYAPHVFLITAGMNTVFSLHFTALCLHFQTQKRILYEWPLMFFHLFWSFNNLKYMAKSKDSSIHIFSFLLCRRKKLNHLKWHPGE